MLVIHLETVNQEYSYLRYASSVLYSSLCPGSYVFLHVISFNSFSKVTGKVFCVALFLEAICKQALPTAWSLLVLG